MVNCNFFYPFLIFFVDKIVGILLWCTGIFLAILLFYKVLPEEPTVYLYLPFLLILLATLRVLRLYKSPIISLKQDASPSSKIKDLFKSDYDDRKKLGVLGLPPFTLLIQNWLASRDAIRVKHALALISNGQVITAKDQYHVAMILQHGFRAVHFHMAKELAEKSSKAGEERANWLAKAAHDRWLISLQKPQLHNTQFPEVIFRNRILKRCSSGEW